MNAKTRITFGVVLFTLTILACSLPANLIPGMGPTATASFTPTDTLTPTETSTPTQSPSPTISPTTTPIPITLLVQENGSTLIADPELDYQFILPKGWGAVNLVGKDLDSALTEAFALYPGLESFESTLTIFASGERFIAIDMVNSDPSGGKVLLIVSSTSGGYTSPQDWLDASLEMLKNTSIYGSNPVIITQASITNPQNTPLAYYEFRGSMLNGTIPVHHYELFAMRGNTKINFTFFIDDPRPISPIIAINQIQNSIQLTTP